MGQNLIIGTLLFWPFQLQTITRQSSDNTGHFLYFLGSLPFLSHGGVTGNTYSVLMFTRPIRFLYFLDRCLGSFFFLLFVF
ncbi:hypothetical protein M758_11G010100 [Ceratodon purpureus]|nr:hypothetical protein M758_11G010100 [Ceratodon purpureus]